MFDITPLEIDEVIRQAQETHCLYVTNNTGQRYDPLLENRDGSRGGMVKQTLGILHVSYRNASGDLTSISVPNTWAPINLAAYANLEQLLASDNLRGHLRKRSLIAMSKRDADKILSTEAAQAALREHVHKAGPVGNVGSSAPLTTFRVGPQSADSNDVQNMPINHDALARLLEDFNAGKITDAVATSRFADMQLSIEDISGNMEHMQATDSDLFNAMIARIESLEAKQDTATFS